MNFTYHAKQTVGTLIRNVDEDGNGSWIEGPFADASVYGGDWLVMGPPQDGKKVYLGTYGGGIYVLDLETETMTKLFGKLHNDMQTFTFTADGDTLLIPDDNGQGTNTDVPTSTMHCVLRASASNMFILTERAVTPLFRIRTTARCSIPVGYAEVSIRKTGSLMQRLESGNPNVASSWAIWCR